jgi:hypothetical protein
MQPVKDGTGKGFVAEVDSFHRLATVSTSRREMTFYSDRTQQVYSVATPMLTVSTSEYAVFWVINNDSGKHLHVERIWMNWNGGTSNHNRTVAVRMYRGMSTPSANNQALTPSNLYFGSGNNALVTVNGWDGVGAGMTVVSNGIIMGILSIPQGANNMEMQGVAIIPKDQVIGITVQGEEVGQLSIGFMFWMEVN